MRAIKFRGGSSDSFKVAGTIIAGCSCATTFAKVLLLRLLKELRARCPVVQVRNIVDDVILQACATKEKVQQQLAKAFGIFEEWGGLEEAAPVQEEDLLLGQ